MQHPSSDNPRADSSKTPAKQTIGFVQLKADDLTPEQRKNIFEPEPRPVRTGYTSRTCTVQIDDREKLISHIREIDRIVHKQPEALSEEHTVRTLLLESLNLLGADDQPHGKTADAADSIIRHAQELIDEGINPDPDGWLNLAYEELTGRQLFASPQA